MAVSQSPFSSFGKKGGGGVSGAQGERKKGRTRGWVGGAAVVCPKEEGHLAASACPRITANGRQKAAACTRAPRPAARVLVLQQVPLQRRPRYTGSRPDSPGGQSADATASPLI